MRDYTEYQMKIEEEMDSILHNGEVRGEPWNRLCDLSELDYLIQYREQYEDELDDWEDELTELREEECDGMVYDEELDENIKEANEHIQELNSYIEKYDNRITELEESLNLKYEY